MENLVIFIEQEKFLRNLLDELFKVKSGKIHTIDSIKDNFYLIADLKPKIIIFDVKSVGDLREQLLAFQDIKFIAIGDTEDELKVSGLVHLFIKKPLIVQKLYEQIFSVLN